MFKVNNRKSRYDLVARCGVVWRGVPLLQVVWLRVFLGGFGWFLLVEGDFGWFQVVCCFFSSIILTAYRILNSLQYSWSYVIDWGHSIFFIKSKTARKKIIVVLSPNWLLPILYCVLYQLKNFFSRKFF